MKTQLVPTIVKGALPAIGYTSQVERAISIKPTEPTERLAYIGKAYKHLHGYPGFRYRNVWETGYDNLIFSTHEEAKRFAASRSMQFIPPQP